MTSSNLRSAMRFLIMDSTSAVASSVGWGAALTAHDLGSVCVGGKIRMVAAGNGQQLVRCADTAAYKCQTTL